MTGDKQKSILVVTAGVLLVALLAVYYSLDPVGNELFPKCPVHSLTGFQCPSCGNQRALHAFLHGRFGDALRYNLFAIYSVMYFIAVLLCYFTDYKGLTYQAVKAIVLSRQAACLYITSYFLWWIIRNLLNV